MRREKGREAGDTLIEVLVAIAIMAMAFVVVAGGIGVAIVGASTENIRASADSILRSAAEQVATDNTTDAYVACAQAGDYRLPAPPAGFTVGVSGVAFWDPAINVFVPADQATCTANGLDHGLQLLSLAADASGAQVRVPEHASLEVVKRQP